MKKRFTDILLVLIGIESLLVSADLISGIVRGRGFLGGAAGRLAPELVSIFSAGLLAAFSVLFLPKVRSFLIKAWTELAAKRPRLACIVTVILALLLYEAVQDLIFVNAPISAALYSGYRGMLLTYFPILVWLCAVSGELLILQAALQFDQRGSWKLGEQGRQWLLTALVGAAIIVLFDRLGLGSFPQNLKSNLVEELNAPLIGLQVLLVVLLACCLILISSLLKKPTAPGRSQVGDGLIIVILILFALVSWAGVPRQATTFTDFPRPPNYEFYPRSDALGYQISAQSLLSGIGTDRSDHVGFCYFLALLDLVSGNSVRLGYSIWLALIACIPALLYLVTKHLRDRIAGLLVGLLFIVRESNSIRLFKYLSFPQLRDLLTEPITILVLLGAVYLVLRWFEGEGRKPFLLLLAGGLFGWLILIRVEAVLYAAAMGAGLAVLERKARGRWLRRLVIFAAGIMLVSGPWFAYQVVDSGSLSALGLGRANLLRRSYEQYAGDPEETWSRNAVDTSESLPYNLGNNLMALFYYLPSNHQPLLTAANLGNLVLDRVDASDLEGDTYRVKYLERYLRSLPFWWNDWDGRLPPRSFLPLAFSVTLILTGFLRIKGPRKPFAYVLVLMAALNLGIYAFVGKSGGRFSQVVDWIPLVFYAMGISELIGLAFQEFDLKIAGCWTELKLPVSSLSPEGPGQLRWVYLAGTLLFIYGISYPLSETQIPAKYPDTRLAEVLAEPSNSELIEGLEDTAGPLDSDLEFLLGKALYPRFLASWDGLEGDNPKGRHTDYSIDRVEFYLVGTRKTWVGLPGNLPDGSLPAGSDVLVVGIRSRQVRFEAQLLDPDWSRGSYFKALWILVLDGHNPDLLACSGPACPIP